MPTAHNYAQGDSPAPALPWNAVQPTDIFEFDCAQHNMGAGDSLIFLNLPAGAFVDLVKMEILTPENGTLTLDVGLTGGTTDGFLDGVDGEGAAGTVYSSRGYSEAYAAGLHMTAAGTLQVLFNNAADTLKCRMLVWAR